MAGGRKKRDFEVVQLGLWIPRELAQAVDDYASSTGCSKTSVVCRALGRFFEEVAASRESLAVAALEKIRAALREFDAAESVEGVASMGDSAESVELVEPVASVGDSRKVPDVFEELEGIPLDDDSNEPDEVGASPPIWSRDWRDDSENLLF